MVTEINIELDEILPDVVPTLYDINLSFDVIKTERYNGIKGEYEARMVIFTNFIMGEKPIILQGSRASGKTNIIEVVSQYAKQPKEIGASSEKGNQRNDKLNEASHFIIPEINKVNDQTIEMLKDFGEGASHNYSYTDYNRQTTMIKIAAKPFITSIADENKNVNLLGDELMSRLTVVRTDSSIKQNEAVISEKLNRAANPFYRQGVSQEKVKQYIEYVMWLPSIKAYQFVYPAGTAVKTAIPPLFTDSRRDTDKYLANTYGITMFHFTNRISHEVGGKNYIFVAPADIWYNHVIFQNVLLDSSLKLGRIEREILKILKKNDVTKKNEFSGEEIRGLKVTEIHTFLLKKSYTPTTAAVVKYCEKLADVGYLLRHDDRRPLRYSMNPELDRKYDVNVDWNAILKACAENMRKVFPDVADEYIHRFCEGEGLDVIHPFTGEKVNIMTWKDEVHDILEEETKPEPKVEPKQEVSKPKIQARLSVDDFGEVDELDDIQEKIMILLEDKQTHAFEEFLNYGTDENVMNVVQMLLKNQEIFESKPGKYQILR